MAILSRQRFFAPSLGNLGFPVDELSSFVGAHLQGVRNAKQGLTVGDSLTVEALGLLVCSVALACEKPKRPSWPHKRKSQANEKVSPLRSSTKIQLQSKPLTLPERFRWAASETRGWLFVGWDVSWGQKSP